MTGPWDFWNRYYLWSLQTPTQRSMAALNTSILSVQITIADRFTPAIRKMARAFQDFAFDLWLAEQPRYLRPLMRFGYWIERLVLR